eukprot:TRINITY_DN1712_c0_g2_i1.p1 TRINITY_DN1712_c0_g2~~TRINITY_DN1712_c0_g2_i1.p1  ORF type:complete len:393 (-),score=126.70 TRINITY_DN1712_c0_g2_i1:123-1301(-)
MATIHISDRRHLLAPPSASSEKSIKRGRLEGIDLKAETLESLQTKVESAMGYTEEESHRISLMICGRLLFSSSSKECLESLGFQNGSYVHVLNRTPQKKAPEDVPEVIGELKAINLLSALSSAFRSPAFNKVVKKINIDSFIATCPHLAGDRIAQSYLSKPEMLIHLLDPETIVKVGKNHPGVIEAIEHLSALVQEEAKAVPSGSSGSQGAEISPFSYHMDDMSDEDEEMSDASRPPVPSGSGNGTGGGITLEVLSAALRNTRVPIQPNSPAPANSSGEQLPVPMAESSTPPSSSNPPSQGPITADIFTQAMAQALGAISQQQQTQQSQQAAPQNPPSEEEPDYSNQLATMRELGIVDEGLARRALGVMFGDLQAAIDLIFSGWLGEDESAN